MTTFVYPVHIKGESYKNTKEYYKEREKQRTQSHGTLNLVKIPKSLKTPMTSKKILKGNKSVLVIPAHKDIPYKSSYFNGTRGIE